MKLDGKMALALATVVVAATDACGGKGAASADGGPDGGGSDATGAINCDPAAQNCAAGMRCDFACDGNTAAVSCRPGTDGGALGSTCSFAMPCAIGAGCVSMEGAGIACRKYCVGDGDCATGERCHNVSVAVACGGASPLLALHFCY